MTTEQKTKPARERVLLVIVDVHDVRKTWSSDEVQEEMAELVKACGGRVEGFLVARVHKPAARYFIGEGKVQEIAERAKEVSADTVIFSCDLKGSQQRNLEDEIKCKTIDRTQLILDIFARHATSNEGKMQVELAQLEYLLPRLVGKGIELSRLGGGIGTLGPGETKLEVDRRRIGDRISRLKDSLKDVSASRQLKRKRRKDKGLPAVTLVGYTNAGKSTLLNTLTQAGQTTRDGLFTTLDSLSRQLLLPNHQKIILSDTVGFMHDLPHHLIESFKATLEIVQEADLLIHVLDASHPHYRHLYDAVTVVLEELEAEQKPRLVVLNKIDRLENKDQLGIMEAQFDHVVSISAAQEDNIEALMAKIEQMLASLRTEVNVHIPIQRMDLVNLAHEEGEVLSIKYYDQTINVRAIVPHQRAGLFFKAHCQSSPQEEVD